MIEGSAEGSSATVLSLEQSWFSFAGEVKYFTINVIDIWSSLCSHCVTTVMLSYITVLR